MAYVFIVNRNVKQNGERSTKNIREEGGRILEKKKEKKRKGEEIPRNRLKYRSFIDYMTSVGIPVNSISTNDVPSIRPCAKTVIVREYPRATS